MQRPDGITLISIYHYVIAGLSAIVTLAVVGGLMLLGLVIPVAATQPGAGVPAAFTLVIFLAVVALAGGLGLAWTVANAAVGWGLWHFRPWARIGALVLAVLRLFNFPLGTIIGGLTAWYLLREDVEPLFRA